MILPYDRHCEKKAYLHPSSELSDLAFGASSPRIEGEEGVLVGVSRGMGRPMFGPLSRWMAKTTVKTK
jgi:hypothetical protein